MRLTGLEVRSMCDGAGSPMSVSQALAMLHRALDHLNAADVASLLSGVHADALRALERAEAKHTAARGRVLGAFAAQGGHEDDGHGTARTWLRWQTRTTTSAAAAAVSWARRLAAHPVICRRAGRRGVVPVVGAAVVRVDREAARGATRRCR